MSASRGLLSYKTRLDPDLELGLGSCESLDGGGKNSGVECERGNRFFRKGTVDSEANQSLGNLPGRGALTWRGHVVCCVGENVGADPDPDDGR